MASGFFAILDDIAALMDDVAVASKLATKKTAGILGDDLAVNAEKATGFLSSRELPVLWAITKGSFLNKLIILPIIFGLNWLFPAAIKIILVIGGLYLAYEGAEKIIEFFFHKNDHKTEHEEALDVMDDPIAAEKASRRPLGCHSLLLPGRQPRFGHQRRISKRLEDPFTRTSPDKSYRLQRRKSLPQLQKALRSG